MVDKKQVKGNAKPLDTRTFLFCTTCGRDNRHHLLKARHFANAKLCKGVLVNTIYKLVRVEERV